ncbi:hypothetical protein H2248_009749 [Termitomyces sp. 'cryptogamus']|nr:hypothetical protein H2248_009749 [Termitomyces sp. 'cryptogamus']
MSVDSSDSPRPSGPQLFRPQLSNLDSQRKDPRTLTSLPELLSCLSALQSEEAEHSRSLTELLNAREPILASLERLNTLVPQVDTILADAALLSNNVMNTAKTAERVGGRVRSLDDEMGRVREAGDRVGQVMDLKASLADLRLSIDGQDWEAATRHCARAMSLPFEVISGPFAEATVPTSDSHLPPAQTLQQAREILLAIFRKNFEQASRLRDSTATSRFFKLFPAIGWEDEGLEVYASFVVDLVRARAHTSSKTSSPLYYIAALTALFESIAMIVDQHQPIVEKYYGPGKMRNVVKRLLSECDRVVKGIIEGWEEGRSLKRKLSDIAINPSISVSSPTNRRPTSSTPEETTVDPREIDKVLSELAGMIGRWSLFRKFLIDSLNDDSPRAVDSNPELHPDESQEASSPDVYDTTYIDSTESRRLFSRLTTTYYIPLEVWYIRTTIDKAHRLSTIDTSQLPCSTTTPDDVFYILKIVISRLLSTGNVKGVEVTLDHLRNAMEQNYISVIRKKIDDVYRHASSSGPVSWGEKGDKENRVVFIILLNDLDISSSHLDHLVRDLSVSQIISQHFTEDNQLIVKNYLTTFSGLIMNLRSALRLGIEQMFNQLMRSKLRTFITDVFKDVSYVLDEDVFAVVEHQDYVKKRFIKAWEGFVDGFKENFTENNYRLFSGLALDVILRPWEKFITTLKFTELGAIRFDQDLRSIMTFLASQTAFGDAREKFIRLQQISTLLNLDSEEDVDEFYNSSGITWKLSSGEARAIVGLKL